MNLLKEIKESFAARQMGLRPLSSLPDSFPAFTIRDSEMYGVAIVCPKDMDVSEYSSDSRIYTSMLSTDGHNYKKYLILCCFDEQYRLSFAQLCEHFVEPGEKGQNRKTVIENTLLWWNKWIGLLGNSRTERQVYSILAEMLALRRIYFYDKSVKWTATNLGSHDLETKSRSIEVKASIVKSSTKVTIHSQFQLSSNKDLDLYFCRMEASEHGISINEVKSLLVEDGYDESLLEEQLSIFGLDRGASVCNQKFAVLEERRYYVDEDFPRIVKESFKQDHFPKNIVKIVYDVDLDGLPYTPWPSDMEKVLSIGSSCLAMVADDSEPE